MPDEFDWADIIRNQIHLIHELVLADLKLVEEMREAVIEDGPGVPPQPAEPDIPERPQASGSEGESQEPGPSMPDSGNVENAAAGGVAPQPDVPISKSRWEELVAHFGGRRTER